MDAYLDGLMNAIERLRKGKAANAPVITTPCNYMVANNPNRIINSDGAKGWKEEQQSNGSVVYTNPGSKAASVPSIYKVKAIHDFLKSDGRI
jgi:hypothetical protein